ncbi:hypothetical protein PLESTB_000878500 [Pleodorina starrii]|uniref:Uncharacterized protein n=1 Tax=Pleodorina starrii TaxID=330485 RepID=A0A9W6BMB9_9CHLO|nr:hypothetical protein PLESTB_000878500 [Pleodorina starrii]
MQRSTPLIKKTSASCPMSNGTSPSPCTQHLQAGILIMISAVVIVCLVGAYYWHLRTDQVREGYTPGFTDEQIKNAAMQKSLTYNMEAIKYFYSSGSSTTIPDALRKELIFFYFTVLDTLCTTVDQRSVRDVSTRLCDTYDINTMSTPTPMPSSISSAVCNSIEASLDPSTPDAPLLRVLSHNYMLSKTCLRVPTCKVSTIAPGFYRLEMTGLLGSGPAAALARETARRLVLMRPLFVTCSMCYLYAVEYTATASFTAVVTFSTDIATAMISWQQGSARYFAFNSVSLGPGQFFTVGVDDFDAVTRTRGYSVATLLPAAGGTTCVLPSLINFADSLGI